MDSRFTNQVVVVTGAASGIGVVIAKHFADAGARLVLSDVDEKRLNSVAEDIAASGRDKPTVRAGDLLELVDVEAKTVKATLAPGVIPGGGTTPWISGGRNASSEITIDGTSVIVPENNVSINDLGYTPIMDSVEEFSIITNA